MNVDETLSDLGVKVNLGALTLDKVVHVLLLILVGVVVYVILVLALRTLTREDLEMMPGGKKLAKILHIQ